MLIGSTMEQLKNNYMYTSRIIADYITKQDQLIRLYWAKQKRLYKILYNL